MATTEKKTQAIKVFISSTYQDLIPYRQKVNESIQRLQQITVGMELFGSESESPLDVCIKRVKEAALFILIVGFRYGGIIEEQGKSITQIEYETAIAEGIPTLVYIIDDDEPVSLKSIDFENAKKLSEFKETLKHRHVVSTFTTPDDLGSKVLADVQRELSKGRSGRTITDEKSNNVPRGQEAKQIFRKFVLRPIRYDRNEIVLPVKIISGFSGWTLKEKIVSAIGLTVGDTISCDINVKADTADTESMDMLNESLSKFSLYAEGINADWLESTVTHLNQTVEVKLRLRAVMIKGLNGGNDNAESLYVCAVVIGHST